MMLQRNGLSAYAVFRAERAGDQNKIKKAKCRGIGVTGANGGTLFVFNFIEKFSDGTAEFFLVD